MIYKQLLNCNCFVVSIILANFVVAFERVWRKLVAKMVYWQ